MAVCTARPLPPPQQPALLADLFRQVASATNHGKAAGRTADLGAWRRCLSQFVTVVLHECKLRAEAGHYDCEVSLATLLKVSQFKDEFHDHSALCWLCEREHATRLPTSPLLRGCYFSMNPSDVVDVPSKLCLDVADFATQASVYLASELRLHGFAVDVTAKDFYTACPHLALFTPPKRAPDELRIAWTTSVSVERPLGAASEEEEPTPAARPPASGQGNVTMTCGVCHENGPMQALLPCGHLLCGGCWASVGGSRLCPFCRGYVVNVQPLFAP